MHRRDHERTRVEDRRQPCHPGLVVVLRPVISEHGKRDVTLQELRRPSLPLREELSERGRVFRVTSQELGGGGRRARPRVEERDVGLAPRERLGERREISNDEREESEAGSGFHDREYPSER